MKYTVLPRPGPSRATPTSNGVGASLLLNALCSLLISATTCFVFIHYSLVPVADNKPHAISPAPRIKSPSAPGSSPAPSVDNSDNMLDQPRVAAEAVLPAIESVLQDTGFINMQAHLGLKTILIKMKQAAEDIMNDNGTDAAVSARENLALSKLIDDTITHTDGYLGHAFERGQSRATLQQLHDGMVELKGP